MNSARFPRKTRFGIGWWYHPTGINHHRVDGGTLKSTVRTYRLNTGRRVTFYTRTGNFFELDVYYKRAKRYGR